MLSTHLRDKLIAELAEVNKEMLLEDHHFLSESILKGMVGLKDRSNEYLLEEFMWFMGGDLEESFPSGPTEELRLELLEAVTKHRLDQELHKELESHE